MRLTSGRSRLSVASMMLKLASIWPCEPSGSESYADKVTAVLPMVPPEQGTAGLVV